MLKSICVLVLAMSAFAGSLAADTQQQCSDVVPDVNLARNDPPKEVEGVTITGNTVALKPGYRFVQMPGNKLGIESIARKRLVALHECKCSKAGSCDASLNYAELRVDCKPVGCKSGCYNSVTLVTIEEK